MQIYLVVVHIFNWLLGHQKLQLTSWQNWRRSGLARVAEREAEVDIEFALDALQKFMRPLSWRRPRACQVCVCVDSCLVTTTAWHWDWHWHWHWLSPFAIAEPQSWCSLSWIFHVIHHINAICMFIPPLCLLASTDLNNFYSLWQPLILHRQLQFSIIFRGSRLSTSPWSSSPPFQSQQQALFLLPLLLWLINCGHFVCAEIPTKAVTTDTWPPIKTLWARTRASDALRERERDFFSQQQFDLIC